MAMNNDVVKDLTIHIHEHIGPVRDRVSRLEGRIDGHEKELQALRGGLDAVRERLDVVRADLLESMELHYQNLHTALGAHIAAEDAKFDELAASQGEVGANLVAIKSWIIGIGLGASGLFGLIEMLDHFRGG